MISSTENKKQVLQILGSISFPISGKTDLSLGVRIQKLLIKMKNTKENLEMHLNKANSDIQKAEPTLLTANLGVYGNDSSEEEST